jgi:hypothetical protein
MTDTTSAQPANSPAPSSQQQAAARPQSSQDAKIPPVFPAARDLGRDKLGAQGFESQQQTPGQQPQTPAPGSEKIKIGDVEISPDEFKEVMQFKGEHDARKLTLPANPEAYELKLPDTFKLPDGVQSFEFNKDDPLLAQARQLAHTRGLDQNTFSDFLSLYAAERVADAVKINNARNAEIAKLGTMAPQRIDAVKTWAHGALGSELGGAIEQMLVTSRQVRAFESIINKFRSQGGTSAPAGGTVPPAEQGKIPGYENMSFEQKRVAQMQQRGNMG